MILPDAICPRFNVVAEMRASRCWALLLTRLIAAALLLGGSVVFAMMLLAAAVALIGVPSVWLQQALRCSCCGGSSQLSLLAALL